MEQDAENIYLANAQWELRKNYRLNINLIAILEDWWKNACWCWCDGDDNLKLTDGDHTVSQICGFVKTQQLPYLNIIGLIEIFSLHCFQNIHIPGFTMKCVSDWGEGWNGLVDLYHGYKTDGWNLLGQGSIQVQGLFHERAPSLDNNWSEFNNSR